MSVTSASAPSVTPPPTTIAAAFWKLVQTAPEILALQTVLPLAGLQADREAENAAELLLKAWTWNGVAKRTAGYCAYLEEHLLHPGNRACTVVVASQLANSAEWICLDLACQTLGVIHAAIDKRESHSQAIEMAKRVGASVLFRESSSPTQLSIVMLEGDSPEPTESLLDVVEQADGAHFVDALHRRAEQVPTDGEAMILFTSGSSAQPKAVVLSHRGLVHNAAAKLDAAPQFPTDIRLNILPFSHAYARTCELSAWILSASQLAIAPDWDAFLPLASRLNPTLMNLVPLLARRVADALDNEAHHSAARVLGNRLRLLQVGGAALPETLWNRLAKHGFPPLQGYGLTEASPVICSNRAGIQQPGNVGYPVHGVDIRMNADGELFAHGPGVMLRYHGDDAATRIAVTDGWLATGDRGRVEPDGRVTILGRCRRRITLTSGDTVDPLAIETAIESDPVVEHCLLVGDGCDCIVALVAIRGVDSSQAATTMACPAAYAAATRRLIEGVGGEQVQFSDFGPEQFDLAAKHRFAKLLQERPGYCQPKYYGLLTCPLDRSGGALTSKGTLRREAVLQMQAAELERIYKRMRRQGSDMVRPKDA